MGSLGCLFFSLLTLASTSRPSSFPGAIPVPEGELDKNYGLSLDVLYYFIMKKRFLILF